MLSNQEINAVGYEACEKYANEYGDDENWSDVFNGFSAGAKWGLNQARADQQAEIDALREQLAAANEQIRCAYATADRDAGEMHAVLDREASALAKAREEERERCAKVCDDRASRNESAAQRAIENDEREEVPYLRAAAWQMSVCANDIRALPTTPDPSA